LAQQEFCGAIAEGLAQAGARVAIAGRNAERGAAKVKQIKQAGGERGFFLLTRWRVKSARGWTAN